MFDQILDFLPLLALLGILFNIFVSLSLWNKYRSGPETIYMEKKVELVSENNGPPIPKTVEHQIDPRLLQMYQPVQSMIQKLPSLTRVESELDFRTDKMDQTELIKQISEKTGTDGPKKNKKTTTKEKKQ